MPNLENKENSSKKCENLLRQNNKFLKDIINICSPQNNNVFGSSCKIVFNNSSHQQNKQQNISPNFSKCSLLFSNFLTLSNANFNISYPSSSIHRNFKQTQTTAINDQSAKQNFVHQNMQNIETKQGKEEIQCSSFDVWNNKNEKTNDQQIEQLKLSKMQSSQSDMLFKACFSQNKVKNNQQPLHWPKFQKTKQIDSSLQLATNQQHQFAQLPSDYKNNQENGEIQSFDNHEKSQSNKIQYFKSRLHKNFQETTQMQDQIVQSNQVKNSMNQFQKKCSQYNIYDQQIFQPETSNQQINHCKHQFNSDQYFKSNQTNDGSNRQFQVANQPAFDNILQTKKIQSDPTPSKIKHQASNNQQQKQFIQQVLDIVKEIKNQKKENEKENVQIEDQIQTNNTQQIKKETQKKSRIIFEDKNMPKNINQTKDECIYKDSSESNQNQEETQVIATSGRVKRDALWKPLLRKFRQWVRSLMSKYNLDVGCHYWQFNRMVQKTKELMKIIGVPKHLFDGNINENLVNSKSENNYALFGMILLIFPTMATKTKNQKRWNAQFESLINKPIHILKQQSQLKNINSLTLYWKIFKENNVKMRKLFFQDELIQFLWTIYKKEQMEKGSQNEIEEYFELLKKEKTENEISKNGSQAYSQRYEAIVKDIQDLSDIAGFQIYF